MVTSEAVLNPPEVFGVMPQRTKVPLWYAAYTRSRHEKSITDELARRAVETYLPLYETVHKWKNGRHLVQMPLFPGYAFVRIDLRDRLEVVRVPGVVDLVGFNGTATPLEEDEVTNLKRALAQGRRVEPHPFITRGRKIRIIAGPLAGLQGIVVRRKGQVQVVVSLDLIQRSVLVEIDSMELQPLV